MKNWNELTQVTQGADMVVEKVRLKESAIAIEGEFELPSLAKLTSEEQVFIAAFIKTHGSIKEMERLFGMSYPTVKNRLNKISSKLHFIINDPPPSQSEILHQLDRGDLTVGQALERLKN